MNRILAGFLALFALLIAARLCHVNVLWAEETLPLAAAGEMHAGKTLYRDIWFDKPPATALVAWAVGGRDGAILRIAGAVYALLCCWLAWGFARDLWGITAGLWAAGLLGFFLIFDFPAAAIPLASDLLMLAPHLAAVWLAWRGRAWLAGALAGAAFLVSPKGALVLAACLLWARPLPVLAGFAIVTGAGALWLAMAGALGAYWNEVWRWGTVYAGTTFLDDPLRTGLLRTANWLGFHACMAVAAVMGLKDERRRWLLWLAIGTAGAIAGLRFFPRYYLAVLPPLTLLAAHGLARYPRRAPWVALLLLIPAVRFAPTYVEAARGGWRDTAMDADSRAVAAILKQKARPGDTLFVWGYRPEIYVYSGLRAATRFLDSQPLTGVPADRHLTQSKAVESERSSAHRQELSASRPVWLVDGLGGYNPQLGVAAFDDLRPWLSNYSEAGRSGNSVIYRRQ
ncbi:MAG TPA: hypothetical protein VNV86_10950 [Candidatus Acidoferrum sp.]|nr:hypothetical protein [Candidatus Acidoferrum sp.]